MKVRLTTDLTRYHSGLRPGVEGNTIGSYGMWSRGSDRFVGVHFPSVGATLDVLWEGLEIIDPEVLAKQAEYERERWDVIRKAGRVRKYVGPRGGFKCLSYGNTSTGFREDAEKILAFCQENSIPVDILPEGTPNERYTMHNLSYEATMRYDVVDTHWSPDESQWECLHRRVPLERARQLCSDLNAADASSPPSAAYLDPSVRRA